MEVAVERPVGDESVGVVCGAAKDSIKVVVIESFAPVEVDLSVRESIDARLHLDLVDVAESDHVLVLERSIVCLSAATDSDERHIEFVARCVLAKDRAGRKNGQSGSGEGAFLEKAAA